MIKPKITSTFTEEQKKIESSARFVDSTDHDAVDAYNAEIDAAGMPAGFHIIKK